MDNTSTPMMQDTVAFLREHSDTRKLAASLIRDLRVTDTELVPSEPTPGSGTEPTPSPPAATARRLP